MNSVPQGWTPTEFGQCATLVNGRAYSQHELLSDGTPVLRIQNLNGGDRWYHSTLDLPPDKYCHAGDLLYAWSASFGPYKYGGPKAIFHYHIWNVIPTEALDKSFGFWLLKEITDEVKGAAHGVAMPHMTKGGMEAWKVSLPPLKEQQRIVAKIEALNEKCTRAKQALDAVPSLLEKLRQSILAAAFRGDLTKDWRAKNPNVEPASKLLERIRIERRTRWEQAELAKMKAKGKRPADDTWKLKYQEPEAVDSEGLPELPEGWVWASLDETIVDSLYGPRFAKTAYVTTGGIPTIRTTDMNDRGQIVLKDPPLVRATTEEFESGGLRHGDLLVTRTGSIGKCAVYDNSVGPALPSAYLIRFRLVDRLVLPQYVLFHLLSPHGQDLLGLSTTSVTQPNVNARSIAKFSIPIPPKDEQERIVEALLKVWLQLDAMGSVCAENKTTLTQLNSSVLAKAFRGELVPQDPNDEPASVLLERIRRERGFDSAHPGEAPKGKVMRGRRKGAER